MAKQSPRVRIRAVDWPQVLEVTQKVAQRHGVPERLIAVPGDFFAADFGGGHQVAVLGHILHSEGPERSRRLLEKVFTALAPDGTLAIQEFMPNDDRTGPALPLLFAVKMLVNTEQGDAYTFAEMSAWLKESGYVNVRLLEVPGPSPLVLANKTIKDASANRASHKAFDFVLPTTTGRGLSTKTVRGFVGKAMVVSAAMPSWWRRAFTRRASISSCSRKQPSRVGAPW